MPCRKESFLLLEQSVTVDSKEVDSLVARIGEALQLNAHRAPTSCSMALKPPAKSRPPAAMCSCVRGRSTPYRVCTPRGAGRQQQQQHSGGARHCQGGSKQLCGRGWVRGSCRKHEGDEDGDPHQLLQELLLSGNLIKEAVRRLQLTGDGAGTAPCKTTEAPERLVQ
ncbi:GSK-3-binding protein-like [Anomaloglossus baeobatrachus]|uniref:GSK-3-binding protein-like n=1 Tax=Anomaloglossus baeobatrachus TaxID=238106 RepID=UPI003F4F57B1